MQKWIFALAPVFFGYFASAAAPQTIVDVIGKTRDLSSFQEAVAKSGFEEVLKGAGPITVFAPTDAAFKKVDQAALDALMRNKEDLTKIVAYHAVSGKFTLAQLKAMDGKVMRTMQGTDISIKLRKGVLNMDHGKIVRSDLPADNGIVHFIDVVLQPQPKM